MREGNTFRRPIQSIKDKGGKVKGLYEKYLKIAIKVRKGYVRYYVFTIINHLSLQEILCLFYLSAKGV